MFCFGLLLIYFAKYLAISPLPGPHFLTRDDWQKGECRVRSPANQSPALLRSGQSEAWDSSHWDGRLHPGVQQRSVHVGLMIVWPITAVECEPKNQSETRNAAVLLCSGPRLMLPVLQTSACSHPVVCRWGGLVTARGLTLIPRNDRAIFHIKCINLEPSMK